MSRLPEGWKEIKISDLSTVVGGGTPSTSKLEYFEGTIPWITPADLSGYDSMYISGGKRFLTEAALASCSAKLLPKDSVIFSTRAPIGYVAIAQVPLATNQGFKSILPSESYDSKYAYYYFKSIKEYAESEASGTTFKELSGKKFGELRFPLAPLPEQKRIVAKLDKLFAHLDQIKARLERIPELLKQFRQAVLTQAFRGRLTDAWVLKNKYTPVNEQVSRIGTQPKPARYQIRTTSILPGRFALAVGKPKLDIPDRYEWTELLSVARLETGHTPSRKFKEYWENGDICWIGIKDAADHHTKTICDTYQKTNSLGLENSAARLLPAGTVCLSRTASVGYVVKMGKPMATSQDFVNWICTDAIDPDWLKWLFVAEEESIWSFGKGSTHTTVYFPEVLSFHVALAPIEEQKEIVRRIESLFELADRMESTYNTLREKIDQLPQAILSKAFRGELASAEKEVAEYSEEIGRLGIAAEP